MMKYVFILAFLCTSLYASIKTSGIGFDYEAATREERVEWLKYQAELTTENLNKALRGTYGYNTPFEVAPLTVKDETYEGDLTSILTITRSGAYHKRKELYPILCPRFQKLPVADHDRKIILKMRDVHGQKVGLMTVSISECARAVEQAGV